MRITFDALRYPFNVADQGRTLQHESNYEAYVVQLIKQVLFTGPGERVFRPEFGCGLRGFVFAPNSLMSGDLLQAAIRQNLETWLGRLIRVIQVQTTAQDEYLLVELLYELRTKQEQRYLNVEVPLT